MIFDSSLFSPEFYSSLNSELEWLKFTEGKTGDIAVPNNYSALKFVATYTHSSSVFTQSLVFEKEDLAGSKPCRTSGSKGYWFFMACVLNKALKVCTVTTTLAEDTVSADIVVYYKLSDC